MAQFSAYTEKTEPVDTDLALIYDTPAKVNKKFTFGNLWKWIAKKIVSEGISQLETTNKTIPGAINELNSKTVIGTTSQNGVKEIELVPLSCGLLSFSHPYDGCALYIFSTFYDTAAGHIYSIKENPRINSVTLNGNKIIMNTSINFTFCCYVYTYTN
nr:MAG TPA: hypothetical protein [Caudoviricetes sp.]